MASTASGGFKIQKNLPENTFRQSVRIHTDAFLQICRPAVGAAILGFLTVLTAFYHPAYLPLWIISGVCLSGFCVLFRKLRFFILSALFLLWIALLSLYTVQKTERLQVLDGQTVTITFTVREDPERSGRGQRIVVESDDPILPTATKISLWYQRGEYKVGNIYRAGVYLKSLENTAYRTANYSESIYLSGTIKSTGVPVGKNRLLCAAGAIRQYVRFTLNHRLSSAEAATICAVTVGEKQDFTDRFRSDVRTAGVSHVMVVSGMHLAILLGGFLKTVQQISKNRWFKTVLGLSGVLFFMAVCGFTMSIIRAGLTFLIASLAPLFKRDYDPVSALSATIILVLSVTPFAALNIAFRLSVSATFAILVPTDFFLKRRVTRFPKKFRKTAERILFPIYGSVFALLFTLPVTVSVFGSVSLISPLCNVLIATVVSWAMMFSMSALILNLLPVLRIFGTPLFFLAGLLTRYTNAAIRWCASFGIVAKIPENLRFFTFLPILVILGWILTCNQREYLLKLKQLQNERGNSRGHII